MAENLDIEDLRAMLAQTLELPLAEIGDESHFTEELEMDSLMSLEIASNLESRYAITIRDTDFAQARTLVQLHDLVAAKIEERSAA
ncbi:acyl carrier protein [Streptacidiphilus jiangxiensis]|uniref:Acyl carrier protein n=1 Tax=Streptacidiphilus jiangxiensis TaxID=235985 RepID=A0A1H7VP08_STRJI|nr:acyl carrier protein [Streptacidiphilus jiangxiensis]SEM10619.1 acyl carrier protein [Streptacidiphilus jiangxiensis]